MGITGKQHHHHHLMNFHFHHHHHHHQEKKDVPKGCLAIMVGQGQDQQRFVIPVIYFNHPLFTHLLQQAEEEYGFDQKGPLAIPCHVEQFRTVQGLIHQQKSHHHANWCFKL